MTVRADVRRMARIMARGHADDEALLLRYYGADGPAQSQTALAASLGVSRQAVHALIKRMLARIEPAHLSVLTVDSQARESIMQDMAVSQRVLDGLSLESAARFYRDITGTKIPTKIEDRPTPKIPSAQFDALVQAAYGRRHEGRTAAARLVLVQGVDLASAAQMTGIGGPLLKRAVLEIAALHAQAIAAYGHNAAVNRRIKGLFAQPKTRPGCL